MKATELISQLSDLIVKHGDLPVFDFFPDRVHGDRSDELLGSRFEDGEENTDYPNRFILR